MAGSIGQASMGMDANKQPSGAGTDAVSAALALLHELPPLSAPVFQLIQALSDEDTDRHHLARLIEQCP